MSDKFNASEHMEKVEEAKDETLEKIKTAYKKLGLLPSEESSGESKSAETGFDEGASRELIEELKRLEELYRYEKAGIGYPTDVELPESLGLQKIEYVAPTDEQITETARSELRAEYEKLENAAEEKYLKAESELEEELEKNRIKEQNELEKTRSEAESVQKSLTESMVLQGLVNSTIYDMGSESIRRKYASESAKISADYDAEYNSIRSELDLKRLEYDNALAEYNLSYAADLRSEVIKLHAEEEKRLKEINEYNRNVTEREAEYREERQKLLEEMYLSRSEAILEAAKAEQEYEREYGVSYDKQTEYVRRFETAKNFYSAYTPEQAGSMMEESEGYLRLLLGDEKFTELVRWNYTERNG